MKQPVFKRFSSLLVLLLTGLLIVGSLLPAFAGDLPDSQGPILVVTGLGQVEVKPDQAKITMAVVSSGKSLKELQEQNSYTVNRVIDSLREKGLREYQIETTGYNAWPQYSYAESEDKQPPRIIGYQVRNQITVTSDDLHKVGQIVDTALKAGANEMQNIAYSLNDYNSVQSTALSQACINANKKANAIARALGIKVGPIISVKEGSTPAEMYPLYIDTAGAGAAGGDIPIQPGNITVRGTVTITYQIIR
ncbi:MAG: SIMPL domain-containing protein [Bacillota bacterium]